MSFYMFRATSDEEYGLENVNLANLNGVLWYLHNEVVPHCPRKFGITRVIRYLVTMKNTRPLWTEGRKYQFGQFVQFDGGKCTWNRGQCHKVWDKYGYVVGCQKTPLSVANYASHPRPVWFSLPGRCPSRKWNKKTEQCLRDEPGGECEAPDGSRSCTWKARRAGEVRLDELSGISDFAAFCRAGKVEYHGGTDRGRGNDFWNGKRDARKCAERTERLRRLFESKYPQWPTNYGEPPCDWYR